MTWDNVRDLQNSIYGFIGILFEEEKEILKYFFSRSKYTNL